MSAILELQAMPALDSAATCQQCLSNVSSNQVAG
ncbi:hypothetical protein JOF53_000538 [Crossiella equi]|uniref:Uncharacterized protein n=1 Tax=Crossiella equi TaxID=130796 RepID=A0ABS5A5T9_9PSEU|nr:hypothetical protein [Crossiella equi]